MKRLLRVIPECFNRGSILWIPAFAGMTLLIVFYPLQPLFSSEILETTNTQVVVREHPKTGKPYVVVTSAGAPGPNFLGNPAKAFQESMRPDYRMLDPKIKSGKIPYQGPVSDRKKVYAFAASLATIGAVGGAAIIAAAPAATGAAAGGAGAYAGAGVGVAAATAGTVAIQTRPDPNKDNFSQTAESKVQEEAR